MEYLVKIPFATLKRVYSPGETVTELEDAKNLLAGGIVEIVKASQIHVPNTDLPNKTGGSATRPYGNGEGKGKKGSKG